MEKETERERGVEKKKVWKLKKLKKCQKKTSGKQNDGLTLVQRNAWKSRKKQIRAKSYAEKWPKQGRVTWRVASRQGNWERERELRRGKGEREETVGGTCSWSIGGPSPWSRSYSSSSLRPGQWWPADSLQDTDARMIATTELQDSMGNWSFHGIKPTRLPAWWLVLCHAYETVCCGNFPVLTDLICTHPRL